MTTQTTITDYYGDPIAGHTTIKQIDPALCFTRPVIAPAWNPSPSAVAYGDQEVPPTSKWSHKELQLFNLHVCSVDRMHFELYIAPKVEVKLPAVKLYSSVLSIGDSLLEAGSFVDEDDRDLREFYERLVATTYGDHQEDAVDDLVKFVLGISRPEKSRLIVLGHCNFNFAGPRGFTSIPDVRLSLAVGKQDAPRLSLVVVEDKKQDSNGAECQLVGEMLAAAAANVHSRKQEYSQTIFGLRVIGRSFSYYRAEFPYDYLKELPKVFKPSKRISIFKVAGGEEGIGVNLGTAGAKRMDVIESLCAITTHAETIAASWRLGQQSDITTTRIKELATTFAL